MRLLGLEITNFKAFYGDHSITLPDRGPQRPVYLFGGLNGAGKTSLTQAVVLALHGARAGGLPGLFASGRDTRPQYQRWLRAAFNQRARSEGADEMRVSVALSDGSTTLTITRSWWFDAAGEFAEEQLEAREDADRGATSLLTDDTAQGLVDQVLPRHLLDFAIFDGEQVRKLDDTLSAAAVRSALDRLLDLDAVERTRTELQRLVRDCRLAMADDGQRAAYESMRTQLANLRENRQATAGKLAEVEEQQSRMQQELDQLASTFDSLLAAGTPGQVSADLAGMRERWKTLRSRLGRHLGEWLYLMPAFESLPELGANVEDQQNKRNGRERLKFELETVETLADQLTTDRGLRKQVGTPAVKQLQQWFAHEVTGRQQKLDQATVDAETSALSQFSDAELADINTAAAAAVRDVADVRELANDYLRLDRRIRELEDLVQTADRDSATARVLRRRDELNVLVGEQRATAEQLRAELDQLDSEIASMRTQVARTEQRLGVNAEDERWLETAETTIGALEMFLAEARAEASSSVQERMLHNLRVLLRKDTLVTNVNVEPATHVTRLIGENGTDVELPSAAEHQLAAMAFIDAVLAASDNPIPVFVDTPLARLDSHHRRAVVQEFWPSLGRQVIVMSTDEEVVGALLADAAGSLAATYRIECDANGNSTVNIGEYVEEAAA